LISCVLSQRTTDINTEKASRQLFAVAKTPQKISKLPIKRLEKLIKPSGFYRQKAKNIKKISKILLEKYNGKIPSSREDLMDLPGVGYKTSAVVLSYCFNEPIIPVDIHVEVVSKRLGFASLNADVENVRKSLEKLIPENKRYKVHLEIIHFGKEICKTRNPRCSECPLNLDCPKIGLIKPV
jgi:endonuclease-3